MRTRTENKRFNLCRAATLLTAFALLGATTASSGALKEIFVSTKKIILADKNRSADLLLFNQSTSATSYRLSIVDMRMTENGLLERLPANTKTDSSAKSLIRFAPQQVTLQPGATQSIRIAITPTPGLEPGEYRSHLQIEVVPTALPERLGDENVVSIRFNMVAAISLPVIYRAGKTLATAELTDVAVSASAFSATLRRTGNRSIRGDLSVYYEPGTGKKRTRIGFIRELVVYVPNSSRQIELPLTTPPLRNPGKGRYIAEFIESSTNGVRTTAIIGDKG